VPRRGRIGNQVKVLSGPATVTGKCLPIATACIQHQLNGLNDWWEGGKGDAREPGDLPVNLNFKG